MRKSKIILFFKSHTSQHLDCLISPFLTVFHTVNKKNILQYTSNPLTRIQCRQCILKHHLYLLSKRTKFFFTQTAQICPFIKNRTAVCFRQSYNCPSTCRLSAPRLSYQPIGLSLFDIKRHPVHRIHTLF